MAETSWVQHVSLVIRGARFVAEQVEHGTPVLVHCSDGWDRTSQLVALSQLLLDPFYRTIDGFAVLIEKDWLAFGHMFAKRVSPRKAARSSLCTWLGVRVCAAAAVCCALRAWSHVVGVRLCVFVCSAHWDQRL